MDNKKKAGMIAGIGTAVGLGIWALTRKAEAAPPELPYCSPIIGEEDVCFATLAELEAYLAANYPPEVIDIIWD